VITELRTTNKIASNLAYHISMLEMISNDWIQITLQKKSTRIARHLKSQLFEGISDSSPAYV